jgi:hypothetical protein
MSMTPRIFILSVLLCSGCVTVNLGNTNKGKKAAGVSYKDPAGPFQKEAREDVDAAWKNPKNGNVISFLSDCKDPSDPPLEHIVQGVISGLTDLKVDSTDTAMYQGREARRVVAGGKVDGVPSAIDLLVFKRNMCIYILSYVGVKKAFAENRGDFEKFIEGFKAP